MSSRTTSMVPSRSNNAAPCNPPVLEKIFWADRRRSGIAVSVLAAMLTVWSAVEKRLTKRTASIEALPHTPQDDVV
jgi:hypothetical protein